MLVVVLRQRIVVTRPNVRFRDEPPLKPLFGMYWPFVEDDDRNLILKGDIDATMEKMGLSASDVKSACDSD